MSMLRFKEDASRQFEFNKLEYVEIGQNLRHLNDLRARAIQNMLTGFGFLIAGLVAVLGSSANLGDLRGKLIASIAILGVVITLIAWLIERRCVSMFDILTERASLLEMRLGEKRQISIVSETESRSLIFSAAWGTNIVFVLAFGFWLTSWIWLR
jgi:hypothetical protein